MVSVRAGWGSWLAGWVGCLSCEGRAQGIYGRIERGGGIERDGHPCG